MFEHKKGYSSQSMVRVLSDDEVTQVLASPEITNRLEKSAKTVQALARKSDDFLYFTIIFLKAAEASLIDEGGSTKKVGSERAWGYWDKDWRWHGNVKPHRNNNGDIFPESELKVATRKWIGMPLCVDHKSDSVDGIRGIILDTYYDEKLKQVVGLCALDKVNYPDLARKVATGVVRFGSMGTAVELSICSEFDCANQAKTAREYCHHVMTRSGWGEVNVGLKPIEYSLVVQPAEPGAKLLRCIASIEEHAGELKSYGVQDVDGLIKSLNGEQADNLDRILNTVCGEHGCSINQRKGVVTAFLDNNGLKKSAALSTEQQTEVEFAEALAELKSATGKTPEDAPELYAPIFKAFGREFGREFSSGEHVTSDGATVGDIEAPATIQSPKDSEDTPDYTSTGGDASLMSGVTEPSESFGDTGGVGPESYAFASEDNNITITALKEDIMKESRLRKRAEIRRRLAYHFGGADGVEPSGTYKDQGAEQNKIREKEDKQMLPNPANLGGTDGMVPGDKEVKEKQKRAELADRMQKRVAYYYGGADGVEPSVYKSEDYHKYWDMDKHMHPSPASLGGTDGMVPGDKEVKEKQKRASYSGPALRTRLTQKINLDGSLNKEGSKFEVFAGKNLIIATTASTIYGNKLGENWEFLVSPEYGKRVVAEIRENGVDHVARLLTKSAQDLGLPGGEVAPPADAAPEALPEEPLDAVPLEEDLGVEEEVTPKARIEEAFLAIEEAMADASDALGQLAGGDVDVNVNVGGEGEEEAGQIALSRNIVENLKVAVADADQSADELACLSTTYDNYRKFTAKQKSELNVMAQEALKDSAEIIGEVRTLLKMANVVSEALSASSVVEHAEVPAPPAAEAEVEKTATVSSDEDQLIAEALELRKRRREALLAKAAMADGEECQKCEADDQECPEHLKSEADDVSLAEDEKSEEEDMENEAHDGIGQHPTKSKVQTNTAEEVANKAPTGSNSHSSSGGPDVQGDQAYSGTASRQLAEAAPSINHADDVSLAKDEAVEEEEVEEVAEEAAEEEVAEHEEEMHGKAEDSTVTAKMKESFNVKKASEEREKYRIKLRRAYDIGMDMQRKGLLPATKTALDRQVDEIMSFDDGAFESFKRSIAMARPVESVKTASDMGGINVGISDEGMTVESTDLKSQLDKLWE